MLARAKDEEVKSKKIEQLRDQLAREQAAKLQETIAKLQQENAALKSSN